MDEKLRQTVFTEVEDTHASSEVVLITVVEDDQNKHVCTVTQSAESVAHADILLASIDGYLGRTLCGLQTALDPQRQYQVTVLQYEPKKEHLSREITGTIFAAPKH